ncbi:MAG: type Z 30S ribosomal protein S14 [Candidatus Dojkabacteria bacterium]|nr:type Z 30S ribosomal protein S14 [Candidatus Dojkabacteria bacterium]
MAKKSLIEKQKRLKEKSKYSSRVYNRCKICGRRRGYFRQFKMCRLCIRKLAHAGQLPGVMKSSW